MTVQQCDRDAANIARLFHDTYERLAPSFGYETRADTKAFDPESANGRLMIAVCDEVADTIRLAAGQRMKERCAEVAEEHIPERDGSMADLSAKVTATGIAQAIRALP